MHTNQRGFTLPELIVASVVLLAALITTAILLSPRTYTTEEIVSERRMALAVIGQGISRYYADKGSLPGDMTTTPTLIGSQDKQLNLCDELVPDYAYDLPLDPLTGAKADRKTEEDTDKRCFEEGVVYMTGIQASKNETGTEVTLQLMMGTPGQGEPDKLTLKLQ